MKGTKLWQAPGSPIIQGRSRSQRPSWQQWLPAGLVSAAIVTAFLYVSPSGSGRSPWLYVAMLLGAFVGALVGVRFTRSMGWRFPLAWGSVAGVAGAALLVSVAVSLLSA